MLYATNTLGAAAGALLAGFVLIPRLGVTRAILCGVAASVISAAIAFVAGRGTVETEAEPTVEPARTREPRASKASRDRHAVCRRRGAAPAVARRQRARTLGVRGAAPRDRVDAHPCALDRSHHLRLRRRARGRHRRVRRRIVDRRVARGPCAPAGALARAEPRRGRTHGELHLHACRTRRGALRRERTRARRRRCGLDDHRRLDLSRARRAHGPVSGHRLPARHRRGRGLARRRHGSRGPHLRGQHRRRGEWVVRGRLPHDSVRRAAGHPAGGVRLPHRRRPRRGRRGAHRARTPRGARGVCRGHRHAGDESAVGPRAHDERRLSLCAVRAAGPRSGGDAHGRPPRVLRGRRLGDDCGQDAHRHDDPHRGRQDRRLEPRRHADPGARGARAAAAARGASAGGGRGPRQRRHRRCGPDPSRRPRGRHRAFAGGGRGLALLRAREPSGAGRSAHAAHRGRRPHASAPREPAVRRHHLGAVEPVDCRRGRALHPRVLRRSEGTPRARRGLLPVGERLQHRRRRSARYRRHVPRGISERLGRARGRTRSAARRHRA